MTYTYTANGRGLATLKTEDLEKTSDSGWGPSDGRSNVTSEYSVAYGGRTHRRLFKGDVLSAATSASSSTHMTYT